MPFAKICSGKPCRFLDSHFGWISAAAANRSEKNNDAGQQQAIFSSHSLPPPICQIYAHMDEKGVRVPFAVICQGIVKKYTAIAHFRSDITPIQICHAAGVH
jgi:hypothetical protein